MISEASAPDPSNFIRTARDQMGTATSHGPLSKTFILEAEKHTSGDFCNFWQAGCTFDTILDYFRTLADAGQLNSDDELLCWTLVEKAIHGYQNGIIGLTAQWYDDWCWWGIAAAKAFDPAYERIFSAYADTFRTMALNLWGLIDHAAYDAVANSIPASVWEKSADVMPGVKFTAQMLADRANLHSGTRNVWSLIANGRDGVPSPRNKIDYAYFTSPNPDKWAVPRFPGGCWQYDISTEAFPPGDGAGSSPNPNLSALGTCQVTLMQGLYLSFCCALIAGARRKTQERLSGGAWDALLPEESYQRAAEEVVGFLTTWLDLEGLDSLACRQLEQKRIEGLLVHERPRTYKVLPNGDHPKIDGYQYDLFWAGDQGLIMGGLMQYRELVGGGSPEKGDSVQQPVWQIYPEALLKGVCQTMGGKSGPGAYNPVQPYIPDAPFGDKGDYLSGSGVFWRYVMRCSRTDSAFRSQAKLDEVIAGVTAASAALPSLWPPQTNFLFSYFNVVAANIGAWQLLR
jgi:hypothetical protein